MERENELPTKQTSQSTFRECDRKHKLESIDRRKAKKGDDIYPESSINQAKVDLVQSTKQHIQPWFLMANLHLYRKTTG